MTDYDRGEFKKDFSSYSAAMVNDDIVPVMRSEASNGQRTWDNAVPFGSVKSEYTYNDYSYYNPSDAMPVTMEEEIASCLNACRRYPMVSNMMDLMSDFGSQGVRIIAADKRQEKFGQEWFTYADGQEFCARFLSTLYRCGTTIVKSTYGKVPLKTQKKWKTTSAGFDPYPAQKQIKQGQISRDPPGSDITIEDMEVKRAYIPLKYTIYNPLQIVMVGGLISQFVGKPIFGLRISNQLRIELNQLPRLAQMNADFIDFQKMVPKYVYDSLNNNSLFFPLDQSKIYACYYKKDDWDVWGKTIIGPILRDLKIYDKLQLADISALNGAVSNVRLWNLGSMEEGIVPSTALLNKLAGQLSNNVGGGTIDFVWGPDLKFTESNTNMYQFLGPAKYQQTISNINAGLGIPSGLTGSSSGASGTESFTGLKTLIERLRYGRNVLLKFLNEQLRIVQEAMGYTKPFKVVFDQLMLSDEAAEKAVLLQMWDRDIISTETLRFAVDIDQSEIEDAKIAREGRKRGKSLPAKASPYHNPEKEHDIKKIFAQRGGVAPSEVGLNLQPKKDGEESPNEQTVKLGEKYKPVGSPMTGRPVNSKDGIKRKKRRVMPKGVSASYSPLFLFAEQAREKIDEVITPVYLSMAEKKNIRSLSNEETATLEMLKFSILSSLQPMQDLEAIANVSINEDLRNSIYSESQSLVNNHIEVFGRQPTMVEKRRLDCEAFANYHSMFINGTSSYGNCPVCDAEGVTRERRLNGNDECANGHVYPSKDSV